MSGSTRLDTKSAIDFLNKQPMDFLPTFACFLGMICKVGQIDLIFDMQ